MVKPLVSSQNKKIHYVKESAGFDKHGLLSQPERVHHTKADNDL